MKRLSFEGKQRLLRLARKRERKRRKRGKKGRKPFFAQNSPRGSRLIREYADRLSIRNTGSESVLTLQIPETWSFFSNPDVVLSTFEALIGHSQKSGHKTVVLDQTDCKEIDHGAASVLNALGRQAFLRNSVAYKGYFPEAEEPRDIVAATGLPQYLGLQYEVPDGFTTFKLHQGYKRSESARRSSEREVCSTRLIEYLNSCLSGFGFALSNKSRSWLGRLLGEALGNAEDHSGSSQWWVGGYFRQRPETQYGDCHITIFNFGRTVHETLSDLPAGHPRRDEIENLSAAHSRGGLFSKGWSEEALWTIYALQEGVSRIVEGDTTRGHGLPDMVEFFSNLGQSAEPDANPRMCLISGRTRILFDGTYTMQEEAVDGGTRRIIAFNKENDLSKPPDRNAVGEMRKFFPGTIITLDFFLDPRNLWTLGDTVWQQSTSEISLAKMRASSPEEAAEKLHEMQPS